MPGAQPDADVVDGQGGARENPPRNPEEQPGQQNLEPTCDRRPHPGQGGQQEGATEEGAESGP